MLCARNARTMRSTRTTSFTMLSCHLQRRPPRSRRPSLRPPSTLTTCTVRQTCRRRSGRISSVPLSVHESASVYSEEKVKLVRGEVEKAEGAEGEVRSALDGMDVKELVRFRTMAEGSVGGGEEVPMEIRRWKEDIPLLDNREPVEGNLKRLHKLKANVQGELDSVSREPEIETRDCEEQRVKYEHKWTQDPSAGHSKPLRQDLKSHITALEAAAASDQQVISLWNSVRGEIQLLLSPGVEQLFKERGGSSGEHLLDVDIGSEADDADERAKIGGYVAEIEERLGRLNKISRERNEVLKDLKEKIQTDDVSHLLLLNRRNTGVEPTLFAAELEKFRPYQQRLTATVHHQETSLQDISALWKGLREHAGRGAGAQKWEERERRKKDTVRRFSHARDGYMEVRDGLAKGLQFYTELTDLTGKLKSNVRTFVAGRKVEREGLVAKIEAENRLFAAPPPLAAKPPVPPPPTGRNLDSSFASLNLRSGPTSPLQNNWQSSPPPPASYGSASTSQHTPPPGLQQQQQQYGTGSSYNPQTYRNAPPAQYSTGQQAYQSNQYQSPPPPPQQPHRQNSLHGSFLPPPPARSSQSSFSPPPPPQNDPYANLGLFKPASPPPPPPPPQPNAYNQQQPGYPTASQYASHTGFPPSQQPYGFTSPQQQGMNQPPQQQSSQFGFPPPHNNYQYGPSSGPPPPSQSQQHGNYQSYGQSYGH